jgi:DivIVA domain-containing protein
VADTVVADTVVGAATRRPREGHEGWNVAGIVLACASALVGIFFIVVSVGLYVDNRDLATHGVRTKGEVVWAEAGGSDLVVFTVGGTDYEVPGPEVGDRLPGEAVTVVYDPRDPANSNLEDDSLAWHFHWVLLGLGLFVMAIPAMPVVAGVFEADGPVGRRLARARPARRHPGTPPTPPGPSDREPPPARQAPPEPYMPGSGDRVPAELRLVLAGYVGIAGGLFATALACAAAAVFVFFDADIRSAVFVSVFDADIDADPDVIMDLIMVAVLFIPVVGLVCLLGFAGVVTALERIRFSRLLRRPSDPRTATVTASKRGGRTLILDIPWDGTGRGYQPLSEVRLALWMKAGMLVPGERVTVYGGLGGESPLLISSAQRGRAFLGTMKGRSTVQPGPVAPLDEKVSGATLVDWAAWAASTTFSSTSLKSGYDKREVDVFRSAVRDTFLGGAVFWVSTPPVRSGELRGKQFSTQRRGYDKEQVDAFLEAAGLRLAAMESKDRPAGPLVSGALLVAWAEWADSTTFETAGSYDAAKVDAFREKIRDTFLGVRHSPVRADKVRGKQFPSTNDDPRYDKTQVDAFLDAAGIRLAAMESTDRPDGPVASAAILADWAEWADSARFSTTAPLLQGYAAAEVDAFREELRDTFLGVRQPPVVSGHVRGKQFSTHRPGYDTQQVHAFIEKAAWRLAAMESTDRPVGPLVSGTTLTDGPSGSTQQDFRPPRWAEWAEWADSTRFSTTSRKWGYDTAEVDAFRQEIRDTFLGVRQPPLTSDEARDKRFRMARRGYDAQQVDAFFDEAEQRLAAMRPTEKGRRD